MGRRPLPGRFGRFSGRKKYRILLINLVAIGVDFRCHPPRVAVQFQVYTHEDLKCSVKVVGQDDVQEFKNFAEAMRAVPEIEWFPKSPTSRSTA